MEKKSIISGQKPKGETHKSYEMNGSHVYGVPSEEIDSAKSEKMLDHYDKDENCNAKYDKGEKSQ